MKKNNKSRNDSAGINDNKIKDLNIQRIRKTVLNETDPDHSEEVEDFIKRYRDDTLTGI